MKVCGDYPLPMVYILPQKSEVTYMINVTQILVMSYIRFSDMEGAKILEWNFCAWFLSVFFDIHVRSSD